MKYLLSILRTRAIRVESFLNPCSLLLIALFFFQFGIDYYTPKWWTFTALSAIPVFLYSKKYLGTGVALLISFFVVQGSHFGFGYFNKPMYTNVHKVSILLGLIFAYASVFFLPYLKTIQARNALSLLFVVNCIWTMCAGLGFTSYYGFDYNLSVTATIISLMLPIVLYHLRLPRVFEYISIGMAFVAILLTKASAGLFGFLGSFFVYSWFKIGKLKTIAGTGILLAVARVMYGDKLLDGSGRIWAWKNLYLFNGMNALEKKGWFGLGFGISPSFIQEFQTKFKIHRTTEVFWWAHNDLLQMFLECGPIIVAYISLLYLFYLLRAYKNSCIYSLMFLISYGANSFTNFPHHHATGIICVIMGLLLVNEEYKLKKEIL